MTAIQARLATTGDKISAITRSAETSLELLRKIDGTVDALSAMSKVVNGIADLYDSITDEINLLEVNEGQYLDAEDRMVNALERSVSELKNLLTNLVQKRSSIDGDPRLRSHHCEALHSAYEEAEISVVDMIESVERVRSAIISYDLKAEPRGDAMVFTTVSNLIASLRSE